jgi:hypothetical protein
VRYEEVKVKVEEVHEFDVGEVVPEWPKVLVPRGKLRIVKV